MAKNGYNKDPTPITGGDWVMQEGSLVDKSAKPAKAPAAKTPSTPAVGVTSPNGTSTTTPVASPAVAKRAVK